MFSKKIVLLDDEPEMLEPTIAQLEGFLNGSVFQVLYYEGAETEDCRLRELQEKLGVRVSQVNIWNFNEVMDKLYYDYNCIFLFKADLKVFMDSEILEYRVNIHYALKRRKDARIWFYTTSDSDPCFNNCVMKLFPDLVFKTDEKADGILLDSNELHSFVNRVKEQDNG